MADEKEKSKATKKTPVVLFREKLSNHSQLKENLLEGLKSGNAKCGPWLQR